MISNHNKRRTQPSASSSRVVEDDISTRLFKLQDDREKEDEELDLEASLFGKKRKRAGRGSGGSGISKSKAKAEQEEIGGEDMGMPGVFWEDKGDDVGMSSGGNDDEMFYEDAPLAEDREDENEQEEEEIDFEQDLEADSEVSASDRDDDEDEETSNSDSNSEADVDAEPTTTPSWLSTPSSSKPKSKKPLWEDPSDNQISLDMSKDNRLRKLVRSQPGSSTVDGQGLESKLREQFEKMHPQPEWATEAKSRAAKEKNMKNKNKTQKLDPLQALFASTASFLDTSSTSLSNRGLLPKGALEVRRLRDANYQNRTVWEGGNGKKKVVGEKGKKEEEGKKAKYMDTGMMDVKFHPKVEVLAAVGADRRLRLFNIDGHTNSSLLSLHIPSLPIKNMQFHPSGTSLLLTGSRPFYYTYDLRSQRCIRSPKNLLSNASASDPGSTYSMEKTVFSPDGSVLAVAGKRGIVTLLAWGPGGSGQVLTTLRSGRTGGVQDMMWRKGGKELWVLGEGSEVDVWDLGERRCVARWKDQGGFGGRLLKGSRNGDYCAVASTTGVVNVYDANEITSSVKTSIDASEGLFAGASPRPIRELMNLTTEITNIAFNHDAQMMAVSSSKKKDAFRMFHLPSATAFTNWPTSSTPLGVVTCSDFSAGSEYVAMGNTRGKILLYSVEHYKPLGA